MAEKRGCPYTTTWRSGLQRCAVPCEPLLKGAQMFAYDIDIHRYSTVFYFRKLAHTVNNSSDAHL